MEPIPAIIVLGMHRSGTSCVAGMLAAAGAAVPGPQVRNWDNARGHFEAAAAVRLSETVLAASGGNWMRPPEQLRWSDADAAERDRLLAPRDGRPALIKDPRVLLCHRFWFGGPQPIAAIGVVRHPLAVARSLASWRRLPLADGVRMWIDHAGQLAGLAEERAIPLVDFDAPAEVFIARMQQLAPRLWSGLVPAAMAGCYEAGQVHHDGVAHDEAPPAGLLAEAEGIHSRLLAMAGSSPGATVRTFPWSALARVATAAAAGDGDAAAAAVREALASGADPAAVMVPACADLLRGGLASRVPGLVAEAGLAPGLAGLLNGKALLAAGDPRAALIELERACAEPEPYFEARSLRAHALHACGQRREARRLLIALAPEAVHPQQALATAAEWAWSQRDHGEALALFAQARDSAAPNRRGRLRSRRAELLHELGRDSEAVAELDAAIAEDPAYARAAELRRSIAG